MPLVKSIISYGGPLILACGSPTEPPPTQDPCEAARAIRGSPGFLSVAEEADVVARVIPGGFGGLFQDIGVTNNLVIYLRDITRADDAKTALRRVLNCGAAYPGWLNRLIRTDAIQHRQGQYTASDLLAYLRILAPLQADPDVWALEVDPETNRVWIGLQVGTALVRIQQAVANAAVPPGAVRVEIPPSVTGAEPFTVLDSLVTPLVHQTDNGVFLAGAQVRYTNRFEATRYPEQCVATDGYASFMYRIEKWDGQAWTKIHDPICQSIALFPRPIAPGTSQTDSVPFVGVRRVTGLQLWKTARITGTYRFVGTVYLATTPTPPFLADPAPEEQNSTPFRIRNTLPF